MILCNFSWTISVLNILRSIPFPSSADGDDAICWSFDAKGSFSVRTACQSLVGDPGPASNGWKQIWRWQGPQRMKVFIWRVSHDRIVTTAQRSKWYDTNPNCHLYRYKIKTTLRVLRDCRKATLSWGKLFATAVFFTLDLRDWILLKLNENLAHNANWQDLFFTTYKHLWNWKKQGVV